MRLCAARIALAFVTCLPAAALAQEAATAPTTQAAEATLLDELQTLQGKLASVQDLTTTFVQEKHTALLRKPLVSSGRIRMAGRVMRWDTEKPAASSMLITDTSIELFYPKQKLLEIYPVDEQLGRLAASPVPRIDVMRQHFSFARLNVADIDPAAAADRFVALELEPKQETLREHIERVRLLIDRESGYLARMEMIDADGDNTIIRFSDVRLNTGIDAKELALELPKGTRVSRPLSTEKPGE